MASNYLLLKLVTQTGLIKQEGNLYYGMGSFECETYV
jgi:hypothetical protein